MKSRIATIFTILGLVGGTGGALAVAGGNHGHGPHHGASDGQYRPGKGCGDRNHIHERHGECKGPHRHHGSSDRHHG